MSAAVVSSLTFAGKQVTIYLGAFTLVTGVLGGVLIIVTFLSLQTFRQSSCAFYLTIMSFANIGQLGTGLLVRIMSYGFGIDWSQLSPVYCKFRFFFFQVCALTSMTCICLATIDQYFATCSRLRWQQWCNIKLARRLVAIFVLFWILHNVPYLIYYNLVVSVTTGTAICTNSNIIFQQYATYGIYLVLGKVVPFCITFFFGFVAYQNMQQLTRRTLPLIRRELDKQLTVMVLVQVVSGLFTLLPNAIIYPLTMIPALTQDPINAAAIQFVFDFTVCTLYMYFATPLYIFLCVSNRFRRQLIYVLFDIYVNRWRPRRMVVNQVAPQT